MTQSVSGGVGKVSTFCLTLCMKQKVCILPMN